MKNSSQSILTKMMVVTGSEHDHIVIRNVWCGSAFSNTLHYIWQREYKITNITQRLHLRKFSPIFRQIISVRLSG